MIGLDTNVLVRYIMQDDLRQAAKAATLMESRTVEEPGFVSLVSVVELVWVLSGAYDLRREQVADALERLVRTSTLIIDRAGDVVKALRMFKAGSADFADCLIERIAAGAGCSKTMTFDVRAAKTAGMVLIQ